MTPTAALALAEAVVSDGFDAHYASLVDLLVDARRLGVSDVLVDVVAGADEPHVARIRALGRVVVDHARRSTASPVDSGGVGAIDTRDLVAA